MQVVIFTICAKGTVVDGALSIQTAYTNIATTKIPFVLAGDIVMRLFFSSEEEGAFSGMMGLIDPDGVELFRKPIELEVPISEADATGVYMDDIKGFQFTFRKSGEYQFVIGKPEGEVFVFPLYISLRQ